mmetsp:Transcript_1008/g.1570  ORF Transcript_1008/g.1570 Transcript_1008/m.1570 type:complete len:655 (+) Transcript_1008:54-2018(+)
MATTIEPIIELENKRKQLKRLKNRHTHRSNKGNLYPTKETRFEDEDEGKTMKTNKKIAIERVNIKFKGDEEDESSEDSDLENNLMIPSELNQDMDDEEHINKKSSIKRSVSMTYLEAPQKPNLLQRMKAVNRRSNDLSYQKKFPLLRMILNEFDIEFTWIAYLKSIFTPNPNLSVKEVDRQSRIKQMIEREGSEELSNYVADLISIIIQLEIFVTVGVLICIKCLLYTITILPLRCLCAIGAFCINTIVIMMTGFKTRIQVLRVTQLCDLVRFLSLIVSFTLLTYFLGDFMNYSQIYHMIRGQSLMKIYFTFNMLELFDKLMTIVGADTQDSLCYNICRLFYGESSKNEIEKKPSIPYQLATIVMTFIFYCLFNITHCGIILCRIVTFNVAMNSSNNTFIALIISNNFLELKKPIFKRFSPQNMFQIASSDSVEVYEILIFGVVILIQNSVSGHFGYNEIVSIGLWIGAEAFIDVVKHVFILKLNKVSSTHFKGFRQRLYADILDQSEDTYLDTINCLSRRLGVVTIPTLLVIFHISWHAVFTDSEFIQRYAQPLQISPSFRSSAFHFYLYMCIVYIILSFILYFIANRHSHISLKDKNRYTYTKPPTSQQEATLPSTEVTKPQVVKPPQTPSDPVEMYDDIFRYKLYGKRIPL